MNNQYSKINKELSVKSSTDNLSLIRDFVRETAEGAGLGSEITGKVVLAVDEACTNIIKHAYKYSPEGDITVKIHSDKNKISITIIDNGGQFNPDLVPVPDLRKLQRQRRAGGLGMFLMKKLMDEVRYSNLTDNRNQVELVKYLN